MFTPIKHTTVSEKVIEQIKEMVSKGDLKKGDKLPSERKMAENLQVSRTSVREALKELEIMGLIESKQGEGNFIKTSFEDILLDPFSTIFLIKESNAQEILELRNVIEKGSVILAAERITSEELKEIKEILDTADISDSEDELVKLDVIFHYKIAQSSKNFLLQSILNAVSSLIEASIKDTRKNILVKKEHKDIIKKQHNNIYNALKNQDIKAAEKAMSDHLEFVNNEMKKSIKN
ncbi:FadR/GntR family transcriptional regulator [Anaerosalibacter massiliensis]|uniref:FadR family transcriptional regulator n=1 Tax=Anaerosalibacter massiliensis TaxID=1347392 RepID=A0A9X2MLW5_9FIRM|nr:FadR/GntR family transcriptional regulator [Anaerosalibacter massiliensis]MCR2043566.1 FadR family transcriptional regulator [Anaerosalibacter massiliensis]